MKIKSKNYEEKIEKNKNRNKQKEKMNRGNSCISL